MDDGHSNLFRSIIDCDLSEDQLETLKSIRKLSRKWVDNDDDSDMDVDDYDDAEDLNDVYHSYAQPGPSNQQHQITVQQSESSDKSSEAIHQELTIKYITGELSFTEFTDLLDISEAEDEHDEENVEVEETSNSTKTTNTEAIDEDEEEESDDLDAEPDLSYEDDEKDKDYVPPSEKKRTKKVVKKKRKRAPDAKSGAQREKDMRKIEAEIEKQRLRRKISKRKQNQLPADLQGLVGEANLCFARGDHEDAIKMCMEVIRLAPLAPEPFQTLGMIYEELGDMDKSLQFALISAYLSPNDAEEWCRLAEMSLERGDIKQAVTCYGKAVHCEPSNIDLMWTRCRLLEQLGEKKRMMEQMIQISKQLKPEEGELGFQIARSVAKSMYDNGKIDQAISTMEKAFEKHSNHVTSEDVNLLLELQIKQKYYDKSVKLLCDYCGVKFDPPLQQLSQHISSVDGELLQVKTDTEVKEAKSCAIPEMLPIDLVAKLILCLIHLEGFHLVKDLLGILLQENIEEIGDLYLDVSEAYMAMGMCKEAIPLLASLVSSEKYNLAAVWLRYGECLESLGKLEDSVRAYHHVVELAPSHVSARMILSGLLQQLGHSDEALSILKPDKEDSNTEMEPKLLLQRCNLLYSRERWEEFLQVAKTLHSSHMTWTTPTHADETIALCLNSRHNRVAMRELREQLEPTTSSSMAYYEEMWDMYIKMCNKLFEFKKFQDLEAITKSSMSSTVFYNDVEKLKECELHRLLACYFNKNFAHAYRLIKRYIFRDVNNNRIWNIFNQIITALQDLRHNRFCLRLMFKNPDHITLGIINGHTALTAGSYKHALGEYMSVFKSLPNDPLVTLCIALIFVHMVCQKFSGKKHSLTIQACAFLNRYLELRGEGQETYYNIGRAMHQMNLGHAAVYYYKKALEFKPAIPSEPNSDIFDLRREIAFNLALIYSASGSTDLAKMYIYRYCVV